MRTSLAPAASCADLAVHTGLRRHARGGGSDGERTREDTKNILGGKYKTEVIQGIREGPPPICSNWIIARHRRREAEVCCGNQCPNEDSPGAGVWQEDVPPSITGTLHSVWRRFRPQLASWCGGALDALLEHLVRVYEVRWGMGGPARCRGRLRLVFRRVSHYKEAEEEEEEPTTAKWGSHCAKCII